MIYSFERLLSILVCLLHDIMTECALHKHVGYTGQFSNKAAGRVCVSCARSSWLHGCFSYLQPFTFFQGVFLFQLSTFIRFCFLSWHSFSMDPQASSTDGVEQLSLLFSVLAARFTEKTTTASGDMSLGICCMLTDLTDTHYIKAMVAERQ